VIATPLSFRDLIDKLIGGVEPPPPSGDTLPHWPDKDDPDQRIRMGCPVAGEDLIHRYREVISGLSPAHWTEKDFLDGYRFEWALADLKACWECRSKDTDCLDIQRMKPKEEWKDPKQPEYIIVGHRWQGCRSVVGGGYYMDLHHKKTRDAGKPVFVVFNCNGPETRRAEIAARQVAYR
jgi:hypothetical protein